MPVWLRKFTIKEINDYNQKQNEAQETNTGDKKTLMDSNGKLNLPNFLQGKSSYK